MRYYSLFFNLTRQGIEIKFPMAFNSVQRASLSLHSSSSSSSHGPKWIYDVFLSFRGKDTRRTFSDHLYSALALKGVVTFRYDQKIKKGKAISLELLRVIKRSRFSIIVLSKGYASSTCCLDELVQVLECMKEMGQTVIPVFYDVDPLEVRTQTGSFESAFAGHEEMFRDNVEKVQRWRDAMTEIADISGWHLKDRHESEIINEVVKEILGKLNHTFPGLPKDLVGIDSRVEEINVLLDMESDDIRIIGICGMGGIGKTTIAQVVYERICFQFEGSCFLANVREVSEKSGLVALQTKLLCEILMDENIYIWDVFRGVNAIRSRLCQKKILLILDDVHQLEQLESLAGEQDWFGPGSRIIITSRDEHLLLGHGVDAIYMAKEMNEEESLLLFSRRAFKKDDPHKQYLGLSKLVISYADGLPLALEVLGSFLFGRTVTEWKSAVDRLKKVPNKNILEILKISYDGLEEMERNIFLDIACFFKGDFKAEVSQILASCGFYPDIGIRVLVDKSLITISDNILWMHDLLQEMGREIVRQESPKDPSKRSRLWHCEDVYDVLLNNKGTEVVEGLLLDTDTVGLKEIHLNAEAFSMMDKLRLLKMSKVILPQGLRYLSNELRFLKWLGYPSKSLPSSFQPEKLFQLDLRYSHIEELWNVTKPLVKLKIMELSHCENLRKTPDFGAAPNLEILILEGCRSLSEIHASIAGLQRLRILILKDCSSLKSLPSYINLKSLSTFDLSGCTKFKKFPEIVGNMARLSKLSLDGTAIRELPLTIEHLTELVSLNLRDCKSLLTLPSVICSMKSLKVLNLSGCLKLEILPENLGHLSSLEELDIGGTAIREPPPSIELLKDLKVLSFHGRNVVPPKPWIASFLSPLMQQSSPNSMALSLPSLSNFHSLTELDLSDCNLSTGYISSTLGCLTSLVKLNLSGNNIVSLPAGIIQLTKLAELHLNKCKRLQSLPALPSSVREVMAEDCNLLETFPSRSFTFGSDVGFSFVNCHRFAQNQGDCSLTFMLLKRYLQSLLNLRPQGLPQFSGFNSILPGSKIPLWIMHQSMGSSLSIEVPPHWCSSDFKGVVVSAVSGVHENSAVCHGNSASGIKYIWCKLDTDVGVMSPGAFFPITSNICIKSDHLWLCFLSRGILPTFAYEWWKCNRIEASFGSDIPGLEVKKCGLRLVYKHDVEEIIQDGFDESSTEYAIVRHNYGNNTHYEEMESPGSGVADGYLRLTLWRGLITPLSELACKCLPAFLVGLLLLILYELFSAWLS